MFRRKRCAYCGRIPVMEHRKAARTECARNSAQLFRVRCSCGNQTEWGLATSGYWRKKVKAMIVRQWNELNSEKIGKFFVAMSGEVRREAFRWGELKRCRMCRKIPISRITPCMNSDYTPVAYWQIEIRCNRHADCDLIMQTQNDISGLLNGGTGRMPCTSAVTLQRFPKWRECLAKIDKGVSAS